MLTSIPHNQEAEVAVLSALFDDPKKYYMDCVHNLTNDHFHNFGHHAIFCKLKEFMIKHPNAFDMTSFLAFAENDKDFVNMDIFGLVDHIHSNGKRYGNVHIEHYCTILNEKHRLRKIIELCTEAIDKANDNEDISDKLITKLMIDHQEQKISVDTVYDGWKDAQKGISNNIPTPYPDLDRVTGGLRRGCVTVFTGRSKSGKSMFLASWYKHLAEKNIPILVLPLEDRHEITLKRIAANHGNYTASELDAGGRYINWNNKWTWVPVEDELISKAKQSLDYVSQLRIHFYDRKIYANQLRQIALRYKNKYDIQAIFVDGAKDLKKSQYNDVAADEECSQMFCQIAAETNTALISVHHLTKISLEQMIDVNSVRGSSNIIADSRSVYCLQSSAMDSFIDRLGYEVKYNDQGYTTTRIFECLSNNHGGTGCKVLESDLARCRFYEAKKIDDTIEL